MLKTKESEEQTALFHSEEDPEQQPQLSVANLDLREKLQLLSGKSLWLLADLPRHRVPSITVSDGPHGVRKPVKELSFQESFPATCFPTACALACSWDTDLVQQVGAALRIECLHYNVNILLGPGLNLKRHPGGGRNFEYFSEDPLLSGRLARCYVIGVQASNQVGACAKHFCINNQESHRFVVDAIVDERTARELYYRGFEIVVKEAQPASIMCAYNKANGVYCSENKFLNDDLLRKEWGFQGVIMTDWGATNDRCEGIAATIDLEMPGSHGAHNHQIRKALKDNTLSMGAVDDCAQRVLEMIQKYKVSMRTHVDVHWDSHHALAKQVAMQCAVLLKNEDNFLPLKKGTSVAVIGDFAREHPRYQGMGSSQVFSESVVTAYDELFRHTDSVEFAAGYHVDHDHPVLLDQEALDEATEVAKKAEVVLLCIGLPPIMESEGFDRDHLSLPAQHNALVDAVYEVNKNVVVALSNGGVVEMSWADKPKAIFEGYLLGETGGAAIVDLIFGVQSPCGKLAETFPIAKEDILADKYFPGTREIVEHREGLDVGYRYFDSANKPVRFPFGHGLSYTTFQYDNLSVKVVKDEVNEKKVEVGFQLTNTGSMVGREIVQCYVHDFDASVYRPAQELKDFCKVLLDVGETKDIKFMLDTDAFSFYDIGVSDWVVEKGSFEIRIGESSRDIRLQQTIEFETGQEASVEARESYPPVKEGTLEDVDAQTFARRFGSKSDDVITKILAPPEQPRQHIFHRNSLLKEAAHHRLFGQLLLALVFKESMKEVKKGPTYNRQRRMVRENVENLPLRVLVLFSTGGLSWVLLDAIIAIMNRRFCAALLGFVMAIFVHFRR